MQTIKELAKELNMSYSQARRRMKALGEIMEKHTKRNSDSKLVVNSEGTELLRRLEELRDQGFTINDAAQKIREDTAKPNNEEQRFSDKERQSSVNPAIIDEFRCQVEELRKDKERLQEDKEKLRQQLEEKDKQIQQLLPGEVEDGTRKAEPDEFKELSLVQVVKKWFTTKV